MPESTQPYIVKITGLSGTDGEDLQGSGVYIAAHLILTCRHVVRRRYADGTEVSKWGVELEAGGGLRGDQHIISVSVYEPDLQEPHGNFDLAVLKTTKRFDGAIPAWCDPGEALRSGDSVNELFYAKSGFVEHKRDIDTLEHDAVQVKGGFPPGSSGGVLQSRTRRDYPCFAVIRDSAYGECKAIRYGEITRFLQHLNLSLPSTAISPPPTVAPDPVAYREKLAKQLGRIDLDGFLINGQRQPVDIVKLWVPARTHGFPGKEPTEPRGETLLSEVVNRSRQLVVLGEAGSGKSTFLSRIGYALARADRDQETIRLSFTGMPLWAPLKAVESFFAGRIGGGAPFPSEPHDVGWIAQYLASTREAKDCGLTSDYFDGQTRDPEALLLLDGFDEVSPNRRAALRDMIESAAREFRCRILISTRPEAGEALAASEGPDRAASSRIFAGIPEAPILPLDREGIRAFIDNWTAAFPQSSTEAAQQRERLLVAAERPGIVRLARNSLMLTAMAVLTSNGQQLPERRATLFEEIVKWLVLSRNQDNLERAEEFRAHLANLALLMIQTGGANPYQISLGRAAQLIEDDFTPKPPKLPLEEARDFLDRAERETGLLTRRGGDLTFWHRYLQEHLAATRLAGMSRKRGPELERMLKSRECPEVVRLMLGSMMPNSKEDLSLLLADAMKAAADWDIASQAYAVGLLGAALEDLRPTNFYPNGREFNAEVSAHWEKLRNAVMPIFSDPAAAAAYR